MNCNYCKKNTERLKNNEACKICMYEPIEGTGLKPCPICGKFPHLWVWNGGAMIDCSDDNHRVQTEANTEEKAVEEWNKRA